MVWRIENVEGSGGAACVSASDCFWATMPRTILKLSGISDEPIAAVARTGLPFLSTIVWTIGLGRRAPGFSFASACCWKPAESGMGIPPTTIPVEPQTTELIVWVRSEEHTSELQ